MQYNDKQCNTMQFKLYVYHSFIFVLPESDPCLENESGCNEPDSMCTIEDGEALCMCITGYDGDGETCVDINECEETGNLAANCDVNAICRNYDGGFMCECLPGFIGNGYYCEGEWSSLHLLIHPPMCQSFPGDK